MIFKSVSTGMKNKAMLDTPQSRYQKRNRARINARRKLWRQQPEVKKRETEQRRKWYDENRELILFNARNDQKRKETAKRWKNNNREYANELKRIAHAKNPEKNRRYARMKYRENSERYIKYQKDFYEKNKERLKPILSDRAKKYREKNKEDCHQRKLIYYYNNRDEILKKEADRYNSNPKRYIQASKDWANKNPEKRKRQQWIGSKRMRERLTDAYICYVLGVSIKDNIPKELIELKRQELKFHRLLKQKRTA